MKKILILVLVLSGCATRKVDLSKENRKISERTISERLAPGGQIAYFPPTYAYPLPEPGKPSRGGKTSEIKKDTILEGPNGTTATVFYHPDGHIKGFVCNCPPIQEKTEQELLEELKLKNKQTERKLDIDLVNTFGEWIFLCSCTWALVWLVRGIIKDKSSG